MRTSWDEHPARCENFEMYDVTTNESHHQSKKVFCISISYKMLNFCKILISKRYSYFKPKMISQLKFFSVLSVRWIFDMVGTLSRNWTNSNFSDKLFSIGSSKHDLVQQNRRFPQHTASLNSSSTSCFTLASQSFRHLALSTKKSSLMAFYEGEDKYLSKVYNKSRYDQGKSPNYLDSS